MKKLTSKEKAIIECYVSKFASVDNWKYIAEHTDNEIDFQRKDVIFRKERAYLWGMDDILKCLNIRFQCKRVDLEKIILSAFNAKNYDKLYEVTLIYSSNGEWQITD